MLWFLRHADAAPGDPDEERPLTERGTRQARAAGRALAQLGVELDACLSSPKVRAMQTATLACEPLGIEVESCAALSGAPFSATNLAAGRGEVLLVGHDPSFSLVLHDMTGAQLQMRKGAIAAVDKGELILLLRPSEVAAIAVAGERVI